MEILQQLRVLFICRLLGWEVENFDLDDLHSCSPTVTDDDPIETPIKDNPGHTKFGHRRDTPHTYRIFEKKNLDV